MPSHAPWCLRGVPVNLHIKHVATARTTKCPHLAASLDGFYGLKLLHWILPLWPSSHPLTHSDQCSISLEILFAEDQTVPDLPKLIMSRHASSLVGQDLHYQPGVGLTKAAATWPWWKHAWSFALAAPICLKNNCSHPGVDEYQWSTSQERLSSPPLWCHCPIPFPSGVHKYWSDQPTMREKSLMGEKKIKKVNTGRVQSW